MTRRAASLLILIAMAIGGAYAVATPRNLNAPAVCQSIVSKKSDRAEARRAAVATSRHTVIIAAIPETPALRAPHLDPRYQRPPPPR